MALRRIPFSNASRLWESGGKLSSQQQRTRFSSSYRWAAPRACTLSAISPYCLFDPLQRLSFSTKAVRRNNPGNTRESFPFKSMAVRVRDFCESYQIQADTFTTKKTLLLIRDCCKMGDMEGMKLAESVMDRLVVEKARIYQKQGVVVPVPVDLWQIVLHGWALLASKERVAISRMQQIMQMAIQQAERDDDSMKTGAKLVVLSDETPVLPAVDDDSGKPSKKGKSFLDNANPENISSQPTVHFYNTYLKGLSNGSRIVPQAGSNAEEALDEMQYRHDSSGWHTKPNTRSYTHAITAYANSGHADAGDKALAILRRMQQVHEDERELYEQQYNIPYNETETWQNKRKVVTADAVTYTAVMTALVRSNSADQAVLLLHELLEYNADLVDEHLFTVAIRAFGKIAADDKHGRRRFEAAQQAEEILDLMIEVSKRQRDTLEDDRKQGQAQTGRSQGILAGYNACLDAWSRSYGEEAAPRCEDLLERMLREEEIKPDATSFNSALYAWSRSHKFHPDSAERAEKLLSMYLELCEVESLEVASRPDFQTYAILILAHANADNPDKAVRARALLDDLLHRVRQGQIAISRNAAAPFSSVLSAVARTPAVVTEIAQDDEPSAFDEPMDDSKDPYSIAVKTYEELRDDIHQIGAAPDHHAYAAFLQCIATHCPEQSTERVTSANMVFEDACEAGQVSRLVMRSLKAALEPTTAAPQSMPGKLRKFWSRNVPKEFQIGRR